MGLDEDGVQGEDEEEDMGSEEDEEDEWTGIGDSGPNPATSGPSGGGGKPKKPPTGEEVRAIKEATELYKSNTFKLRVRSLSYFPVNTRLGACNLGFGRDASSFCGVCKDETSMGNCPCILVISRAKVHVGFPCSTKCLASLAESNAPSYNTALVFLSSNAPLRVMESEFITPMTHWAQLQFNSP